MGTFRQSMDVGDFQGQRFESVDALVDTGATYTTVSPNLAQRLGITPEEHRNFRLANGQSVNYRLARVRVRLDGREQPTLVIIGDGPQTLLGAFTLEGFGLAVDPFNKRLIPAEGYLVGVASDGLP